MKNKKDKQEGLQLGDLIKVERLKKPEDKNVRFDATLPGANIDEVASRIEGDRNVTASGVADLVRGVRGGVENRRVNYYGEDLSLEEYRAIANRKNNEKMYELLEIGDIRGAYEMMPEITYLPRKCAKIMAESYRDIPWFCGFKFNNLVGISDEAIEILMTLRSKLRSSCGFFSQKLNFLSLRAARSLAASRGALALDGLTSLESDVAQALGKHDAWLELNGLISLSPEAAEGLSKHQGVIRLNGIVSISKETAEALSKLNYDLSLGGLTSLSVEVAKALSKHKTQLFLDGLITLSVEVAEALSKYKGKDLCLRGLTSLNGEAARALAKYPGYLYLQGLTDLNEETIEAFSNSWERVQLSDELAKKLDLYREKQRHDKAVKAKETTEAMRKNTLHRL